MGLLASRCSTGAATWDKTSWQKVFKSVGDAAEEYQISADMIEGAIPADFVGTLYRCGPGLFEVCS